MDGDAHSHNNSAAELFRPTPKRTMDQNQLTEGQLTALAAHFEATRPALLKAWHDAVNSDLELTTASTLPRTQFYDHIPDVLDAFARKLHIKKESATSEAELKEDAAAHGLHRWQQGYHLREVTREWSRLQMCLANELQSYEAAHPELAPGTMSIAWRALSELCAEGVSESTAQYSELQQMEAAGHVRDLEGALEQVHELERERAELWRQAAHDLHGNLGVAANATAGLTREGVPEQVREKFLVLLKKNMSALHTMLDDVMNLARLQAGQEALQVQRFDAAALLKELCESLHAIAAERGLYLNTQGPETLSVEGDAVKLRRIVQNLLLNALKYTRQGGVTLSWGDSRKNDTERWMLTVQDTGPGLRAGPGAPLAGALQDATDEARYVDEKAVEETVRETTRERPHSVWEPEALKGQSSEIAKDATQSAQQAAKRPATTDEEFSTLLDRLLRQGKNVASAADKEAVVNVLVARGMSREEAERTVTNWQQTYQKARAEAEAAARQAADQAARATARASLWGFFGLLLGAIAAALGGMAGRPRTAMFS